MGVRKPGLRPLPSVLLRLLSYNASLSHFEWAPSADESIVALLITRGHPRTAGKH